MSIFLEVCAGSLTSAINAQLGGTHRIELCDNLPEGGTTPSPGIIRQAVKLLHIPVFVLIRPRAGDFLYSEEEFDAMKQDIIFCKERGAKGIVMGILRVDGSVDIERMKELIDHAKPMQVTFHRAFDMTADPFKALEDIIGLGIDRILTSGQAASAIDGNDLIKQLINRANNRIIIMPGGGINEENILELKNKTNAVEFHGSLQSLRNSQMNYGNQRSHMAKTSENETWMETDPVRVRNLLEKLI